MDKLYRMLSDQGPLQDDPRVHVLQVVVADAAQMPFHRFCGHLAFPIPQSPLFCFQWPAPEISLTIQGLLEHA